MVQAAERSRGPRPWFQVELTTSVLFCLACAGLRPGTTSGPADGPHTITAAPVEATAPANWGSPTVSTPPMRNACAVIWEARWPLDGPEHEPARLRVWSYAAAQPPDPEDEPFGLTAAEKAAAIQLLQQTWDKRAAEHLLRPPGAYGPELAARGLFWGQEDTFTLAHSWSYLEADGGALRGLRVLGTEGQDDGLAPDLRVWLGRPADRLVVELRVPLPAAQLAPHQAQGPAGIRAGAEALRGLDRSRAGAIGARLDEADVLLRGLKLRAR